MKTRLDILREARELIARPGGWTKQAFAKDAGRQPVSASSPLACSFCLSGALERASGDERTYVWLLSLLSGIDCLAEWNDDPQRRKVEVVAFLDRAIRLAEQEPAA